MTGEAILVDVLLFAAPREALGSNHVTVTLPAGSTVDALLAWLASEYPALAGYRRHLQVAINHCIAGAEAVLHDADEVALLPPVGGG